MDFLHHHRFELFFGTLLLILFGPIIIPGEIFDRQILPFMVILNMAAALLLNRKQGFYFHWLIALLTTSAILAVIDQVDFESVFQQVGQMAIFLVFYATVAFRLMVQLWEAERVDKTVIFGLMSGYIVLGLIAFLLFDTIEIVEPGSFVGPTDFGDAWSRSQTLMYYAYITLLTVGYGEIVPLSGVAQKAAILAGLAGQFYIVIVTAIIVGKYLQDQRHD